MKKLLLPLVAFACMTAGCAVHIYPEPVYTADPPISRIAVAPFLISESVATMKSQPFPVDSFMTSDGATAWYSTDFAEKYSAELMNFGFTVTKPTDVERQWKASMMAGKPTNPMATREEAIMIGRTLNVDAIITAEVCEWDPYVPLLTLDWAIYYTREGSASAMDVRMLERAGKGGTRDKGWDNAKAPVYAEQVVFDARMQSVCDSLDKYADSLADENPYTVRRDGITKRPYPAYVRFAAWAAMCRAYDYQRTRIGK